MWSESEKKKGEKGKKRENQGDPSPSTVRCAQDSRAGVPSYRKGERKETIGKVNQSSPWEGDVSLPACEL